MIDPISTIAFPYKLGRFAKIGPEATIGRYFSAGPDTVVQRCTIGAFCSFGARVSVNPRNHPTSWLSIHEFEYHDRAFVDDEYVDFERLPYEALPTQRVTIGNDVWIGNNACVMAGVTVADGAAIGAGAVVTHDVRPYQIVGGVPARHIRDRFPLGIMRRLLAVKWWDRPMSELSGLPFRDIYTCLEILESRTPLAEFPTGAPAPAVAKPSSMPGERVAVSGAVREAGPDYIETAGAAEAAFASRRTALINRGK